MQMYEVVATIRLDEDQETTRILVCAANADQALQHAAVAIKVSPSYGEFEVKRVKGNSYIVDQWTRPLPMEKQKRDHQQEPARERTYSPDPVRRSMDAHPPKLSRRVVNIQARVYSRTDRAAYVAVGKAIEQYGKAGTWRSEYVDLESAAVQEDAQREPNNPRWIDNAAYTHTKVYR